MKLDTFIISAKNKCKNRYLFLVINAIIVTKAICQMSEYEIKFL